MDFTRKKKTKSEIIDGLMQQELKVSKKPKPKAKENVLTKDERDTILNACVSVREKIVIWGLFFTGMRISEFIHLKRSWINLEKGEITIPRTEKCACAECVRVDQGYFLTKTTKSARTIPIVPQVRDLFVEFFSNYNAIMDVAPHRQCAWRIAKSVGRRVRLNHKLFPHAFRATFATILLEMGFAPEVIMDVLGWTSRGTMDIYVKIFNIHVKNEFQNKWKFTKT